MPIQKPDFNQIFASQAPDIDKPPVFNNYNGGWGDESRPNNGKPTIKGFNYLQQQTDNKLLWMMQNGAFPYDSTVDYAVGVVTIKDGRFKQWNGTTWVNFGQDDGALKSTNNLSDLPNKPRARTNLDVYSTAQVNAAISAAIPPETPDATETTAGKAKIATTAIAQSGTNDTDFLTAKKLRDGLNASGEAPIAACRAWVNFSGNGSIINSMNVRSVTRLGTGSYSIEFITQMPNENYAVVGLSRPPTSSSAVQGVGVSPTTAPTQTILRVINRSITGADDPIAAYVGVFA